MRGGTAIGYDDNDRELVRVPITQPLYERSAYDESADAIRTNTP